MYDPPRSWVRRGSSAEPEGGMSESPQGPTTVGGRTADLADVESRAQVQWVLNALVRRAAPGVGPGRVSSPISADGERGGQSRMIIGRGTRAARAQWATTPATALARSSCWPGR